MDKLNTDINDWFVRNAGLSKVSQPELNLLFTYHNLTFPDSPSYNKSCGSCVERVHTKLKTHWELNIVPNL